jgi:hypothetical protein
MPPEIIRYRWFASAYGWTPAQVDDLWEDEDFWLPLAEEAFGRVAEMRRNAERNKP